MKCQKCCQEKKDEDFYLPKSGHINKSCKECEAIRKSQLYINDKTKYKLRARLHEQKKVASNKILIETYKSNHPCIKCGESDICCLDLHHVDPSTKLYDFGTLKKKAFAIKTILTELAKCVSLCSNCHRKLHAGRFTL
jgi:hypothetical protein